MPSEQRLHPSSILFAFGASLKRFAVPGLLVLIAGRSSTGGDVTPGRVPPSWEVWTMFLLVPAMLHAVARYLSFRVRYESTELVIRSGILFRNVRHIPYERIQNLEAVRNPVHRLLGVVEVRVENASAKEPEATISVLPIAAFEEMRRRVFAGRSAAGVPSPGHEVKAEAIGSPSPGPSTGEAPLLQLPLRELLLCGFIENRGLVVVGAIYGLLWEFGGASSLFGRLIDENAYGTGAIRETVRMIGEGQWPGPDRLLVVLAGIAGFLLLVRILSMAWAVVRLHGFRLTRAGDDLRTEFGLFTRVTGTIPVGRVQTVTIRQRPLHRRFERASVRVETAGGTGRPGQGGAVERDWLAPIVRTSALPELLGHLVPRLDLRAIEWQPVHARAFRRAVKPALFLSLVSAAAVAGLIGPRGVYTLPLLAPWFALAAWQHVRHLGWAVVGENVVFKSGWLWRSVTIVRVAKIQAVSLRESPFDRRTQMARVRVDTAGAGERSHRIDVPYLPHDVAIDLHHRLATAAAGTDFRW
jgi:putative membrane protein